MNNYKNIIFDFGGVIIHIDYRLTESAFKKLGIKNFDKQYSKLTQSRLFDEFEMGMISASEFRNRIRNISTFQLSDDQIDEAWNAMLVELPKESVDFLMARKKNHRLFLLSNTNEIHELAFTKMIQEKFGKDVLKVSFEHIYFSHRLKMRKPDPDIFRYVLNENNLLAEETLFVDDSFQHIEGARKAGLATFHFESGKVLDDILR